MDIYAKLKAQRRRPLALGFAALVAVTGALPLAVIWWPLAIPAAALLFLIQL